MTNSVEAIAGEIGQAPAAASIDPRVAVTLPTGARVPIAALWTVFALEGAGYALVVDVTGEIWSLDSPIRGPLELETLEILNADPLRGQVAAVLRALAHRH